MSDLIRREDVIAEVLAYLCSAPAHDEELLRWDIEQLIRALPAVQPDAAAIREAALQDAISRVRQSLVDDAHKHGSIVTTRSSAMFTAEIIATNALSRLLSTSTGKEVMPDVPDANSTHQSDTAPAGLNAGGGAGQMADTPMITGLVASNLTARGNAATWALYDANLTRMTAVQPAHVNETPKNEHEARVMLTPATKGGDA